MVVIALAPIVRADAVDVPIDNATAEPVVNDGDTKDVPEIAPVDVMAPHPIAPLPNAKDAPEIAPADVIVPVPVVVIFPDVVISPVDVNVDVFIDELFNVVIVSLPWAVGYDKKLFFAVASVK